MRVGDSGVVPVQNESAEIGHPQWVFGLSRWAFIGEHEVLASVTRDGADALSRMNVESGRTQTLASAFTSIGGIETEAGWAACIAGSPTTGSGLFV